MVKTFLLRYVPLFRGLLEPELEALANVATVHRFPRNNRVIVAEDTGDTFFAISRGKVRVSLSGPEGREVILATLGPGEFFGDMSLLDGRPRSANVVTVEPSELLALRRVEFLCLVQRSPEIAIQILQTLAARLRRANYQVAGLSFLGIVDRVSDAILSLLDEQGEEIPEGVVIHNRPTYQTLAEMIGATRESVSRAIRRLREGGYIVIRGRDILFLRFRKRRRLGGYRSSKTASGWARAAT